jgi:hypothetical protein
VASLCFTFAAVMQIVRTEENKRKRNLRIALLVAGIVGLVATVYLLLVLFGVIPAFHHRQVRSADADSQTFPPTHTILPQDLAQGNETGKHRVIRLKLIQDRAKAYGITPEDIEQIAQELGLDAKGVPYRIVDEGILVFSDGSRDISKAMQDAIQTSSILSRNGSYVKVSDLFDIQIFETEQVPDILRANARDSNGNNPLELVGEIRGRDEVDTMRALLVEQDAHSGITAVERARIHLLNIMEGNIASLEDAYTPRVSLIQGHEFLKEGYGLYPLGSNGRAVHVDRERLVGIYKKAKSNRMRFLQSRHGIRPVLWKPQIIADLHFEEVEMEEGSLPGMPSNSEFVKETWGFNIYRDGDVVVKVSRDESDLLNFFIFHLREIDGEWKVIAEYI